MSVKIGDRVIYRPRVPYGRQSELFGFVTRVIDAESGVVDIIAFPAGGEFQSVNNVAQKSDQVQIHCWEPSAEHARIAMLESRLSELEEAAGYKVLVPEGRPTGEPPMDLGEPKRGPGRPRKNEAA